MISVASHGVNSLYFSSQKGNDLLIYLHRNKALQWILKTKTPRFY